MSTLSDFESEMESTLLEQLGDPITYTPNGGEALSLHAWVKYDTAVVVTRGSSGTVDAVEVEVAMSDVATPNKQDTIALPGLPGSTYRPASIKRGTAGLTWVLPLMRAS